MHHQPVVRQEIRVVEPPPIPPEVMQPTSTFREKPAQQEPKTIPETIRKSDEKEFGKNSPNNSDSEMIPNSFDEPEPPPQGEQERYKKIGSPGRKRKYEEAGKNGEIPVMDVVLFRHIKGRHWPKMSQDMKEWYEFYYFKKPVRAERAKDAEDYTRHCKSWERGQRWISEYEASQGRSYQSQTVGYSGKIVAYRKRANS